MITIIRPIQWKQATIPSLTSCNRYPSLQSTLTEIFITSVVPPLQNLTLFTLAAADGTNDTISIQGLSLFKLTIRLLFI